MFGIVYAIIMLIGFVMSTVSSIYFIAITIAGGFRKKTPNPRDFPIDTRFAVVIAAHNERHVIASTVEALNNVEYPKGLIDIYIVADNCSDETADIARSRGVTVFERFDNINKGKGYALTWAFDKVWESGIHYDAICLLDADNLVDQNYFLEMNRSLHQGFKVVQGYLGCKNPEDSWISGCYSISYWLTNRLFQLARFQLGMSCGIGGTGFVVRAELLKEIGWDSHCLTEDLEFQLKMVERNIKVAWNHEAIFYDEKPITLKQSIKQRTRWMQGHSDCATRFFLPLIKKSVKDKDFIAFDTAFYLIQPYWLSIIWIVSIISILFTLSMSFFDLNYLVGFGYTLIIMEVMMSLFALLLRVEKKLTPKIFGYLMIFPFFAYTWLVPIFLGWRRRKQNAWVHTEHTRAIDVKEML